ncbi:DUF1153 domain-containing protein [Rhodobacteraceae bacterium NNCM2]|nr:DUF1153 domain-containing protein [Coraliihabitans acroporae]
MGKNDEAPYVIGPDGEKLTASDLPSARTRRWVPRRKARVVAAVEGGLISQEEALKRYSLSDEEYEGWKKLFATHGLRGLCVTQINHLRTTSE